jgi:PAS domain S-box-containing protein
MKNQGFPDLHTVVEASQHFMGVLSPEGVLLDANHASLKAAGVTLEEVLGQPFWEAPWWAHDPVQAERLKAGIRLAANGESFWMVATHPKGGGGLLVVDFSLTPLRAADGRVLALLPEGRNISDLVLERERLRLSETRFHSMVEHSAEAIVVLDLATGRFVDLNARAEALFKADRECLMGLGVLDISPPFQPDGQASGEAASGYIGRALELGTVTFEWMHRALDGELIPSEVRLLKLQGSDGDLIRGSMLDLRPRLAREAHLRESEAKFRLLFERSVDGLLLLDGDRFIECNPSVLEMMRCSQPEFLRLHPWELSPPVQPDGRASDEKAREMIATAYEKGAHRFEWIHRRMDGEDFPVEVTLIPIPLEGREILFTTWRDITDRKRAEQDRLGLERQMLHAQKLESLGVLAGGIAHDFNNLLTAILGNLNLAQMGLPGESPVQAHLEATERAVLKAAELTRQMLAYSGKGRFVVKAHDLNQVVREMTHLVQVSINKKTLVRFNLEAGLPPVEADEAQIQQVILNLVTNASDAIGEREGVIRIATYRRDLAEADLATSLAGQGLRTGPHAVLEVGDSGIGMRPEVQARIFDPFFTTKATGHGLGLSAMLGILKGHHAGIKVVSEPGQGTTFKLFFPASAQALPEALATPAAEAAVFSGLALLVDDEPAIRESTAQAMAMLGFEVEAAIDGQDAVERFSLRPLAYRVVLLDLTMPRMDGRECFRALRQLRPEIPVILCSGFSEKESVGEFLGMGLAGFIQKPYSLKALREAFAEALRVGA